MIAPCMAMVGKGGTLVVTSITNMMNSDVQLSLFDLAMMNKEIKGTIFGSGNPRFDIPNLLSMYREGALKLDELITTRYSLDQINQGYDDMNAGKNIRGIIEFSIDRNEREMTFDRALVEVLDGPVLGRRSELELLVAALASGRHILLEGPPGTGKSTLLRSIAQASELGV
jgi:predicted NACHT family NTPase